jgi:hypothetical protein
MSPRHSNLSVARIGRSERAEEALRLRKAGLTFRQIGARMGFTEQRAHHLVSQELARLNAKRAESAAAVTRLELERLDALLAAVWPKALEGDLPCIDRVLAVLARRARLLGLDAEKPAGPAVALQNVNVHMEALDDAQRAAAIAAVLARVGHAGAGPHPAGPDGAAGPLLGGPGGPVDRLSADAGRLADEVPALDLGEGATAVCPPDG